MGVFEILNKKLIKVSELKDSEVLTPQLRTSIDRFNELSKSHKNLSYYSVLNKVTIIA